MKKLFLALIIFVAFALSASAQVSQPFSLYAGGLMSLPNSPDAFKDTYKNGWHGMVGLGYKVMPNLQLIGKVEYHSFAFDFDEANLDGYTGGTNKLWMFGADARFGINLPSAPISPYILGGGGVASVKQSEFEGAASLTLSALNSAIPEDQTKAYFNVGGGIELKSGPAMSLFAQVRYVSIQTEGEASTFIPVTLGLKFF